MWAVKETRPMLQPPLVTVITHCAGCKITMLFVHAANPSTYTPSRTWDSWSAWNNWAVTCRLYYNSKSSVPPSGPQKDLKPSVQRDLSVRRAAERATFQEAAFLSVRLRPLLPTRPDWPGGGGQPAGLQRGQRGQAHLEGYRGGHRGEAPLLHLHQTWKKNLQQNVFTYRSILIFIMIFF